MEPVFTVPDGGKTRDVEVAGHLNANVNGVANGKVSQVANGDVTQPPTNDDGKPKKVKPEPFTLWKLPSGSKWRSAFWFYTWPIRFVLTMTLINPRTHRRFYPLTFILCVVWVGIVSYLIFWMLVVIGDTFAIPESVLGMTILALGGCTPEMITGMIMARKGQAGTGIANSLGASSLGILLSLGLVWFIKVLINYANGTNPFVEVSQGPGLIFTVVALMFVAASLFVILAAFKFILRRITSIFLACAYSAFVTFAVLIELDVIIPENSC